MTQTALPDSTQNQGPWNIIGAATVHQAIDEGFPANDGTDYVWKGDTAGSNGHVTLSNVNDPQVSTGHWMRCRMISTDEPHTFRLQLRRNSGQTIVASMTVTNSTNGVWETFSQELTAVQADAITNYSDLDYHLITPGQTWTSGQLGVTAVDFLVPDPPAISLQPAAVGVQAMAPAPGIGGTKTLVVVPGGITGALPTPTVSGSLVIDLFPTGGTGDILQPTSIDRDKEVKPDPVVVNITRGPVTLTGGITLELDPIAGLWVPGGVTVTLDNTIAPAAVMAGLAAPDPTIVPGGVTVEPAELLGAWSQAGVVVDRDLVRLPDPVVALGQLPGTIVDRPIELQPGPTGLTLAVPGPTILIESLVLADPTTGAWFAPDVTVDAGGADQTATPDPVGVALAVVAPTVLLGATITVDPVQGLVTIAGPEINRAITIAVDSAAGTWTRGPVTLVGQNVIAPDPLGALWAAGVVAIAGALDLEPDAVQGQWLVPGAMVIGGPTEPPNVITLPDGRNVVCLDDSTAVAVLDGLQLVSIPSGRSGLKTEPAAGITVGDGRNTISIEEG